MLSSQSLPVIEATLPVINDRIPTIAPEFYRRLFEAHPELRDGIFNRANERSGVQAQALAHSVVVFAAHLVANPEALPERTLGRIAHRHASLGVTRAQYDVVYDHLFAAIAADLGEVLTPDIAQAWTEVYWLMAYTLIALEDGLYAAQANDAYWTNWRVVRTRHHDARTVTITAVPADDTPVTQALPGQYVSVRVPTQDGLRQARQYSLIGERPGERSFVVREAAEGEVSSILTKSISIGDVLEVSNPYGEMTLPEGDAPLVFISAGVGCTPFASILAHLRAEQTGRKVTVHHSEKDPIKWALGGQICADAAKIPGAEVHLWLTGLPTLPPPSTAITHRGRFGATGLDLPEGAEIFLCGPIAFMHEVREDLLRRGIAPDRVHYEVFGPDAWLGLDDGLRGADAAHAAHNPNTSARH